MSNGNATVSVWNDCPFQVGKRYRVRHSFVALRDSFKEGEELIFDSSAYSRYDGIMGYFFRQDGREGLRMWDIYDDVNVSVWKDFFEAMEDLPPAAEA